MTRSVGEFIDSSYDNKRTKKRHKRFHIKLELDLVESPEFPFKPGDKLLITLENEKLMIEKL